MVLARLWAASQRIAPHRCAAEPRGPSDRRGKDSVGRRCMKLSKRVMRCLLLVVTLLAVAMRFPRTEHEVGVDSFFIHNLATNIRDNGFAEWILSPLSFLGWYPL